MAGIDEKSPLVLLFNGANDATSTVDSSLFGKTVSANGNFHLDTSQSVFGGSSGKFDGYSDSLSTPDSDDWYFGTGDFSLDVRARWEGFPSNYSPILATTEGYGYQKKWSWGFYSPTGMFQFNFHNPAATPRTVNFSWSPSVNVWYWLLLTRSGSTWKFYVDGTQTGETQTEANEVLDIAAPLNVGWDGEGSSRFQGWLDSLRISKGIVRSSTMPTEEYTADIFRGVSRKSEEHGFDPRLIGGRAHNTNRTYFHAPKTYAILISGDTQNVNLRDEADALGYTGETEASVTCEIASGVTVGSVDSETPALDTGEFPEGLPRISIVNHGSIVGYDSGGTALFAQSNILINNLGTIRATGAGYALDGLTFMEWQTVGDVRGMTNGDFFGYHTRVSSLHRVSREIFPEEILRGRSILRRAPHMYNLYTYYRSYIQSYRVAEDALDRYELYLNGSTTPDATSSTLPFTKEIDIPVSGTEEISVLVKKRNRFGLVSFNQTSIILEIDSYGAEDLGPLTKPTIMSLDAVGVGSLIVRASYADGQDRNPADKWNLFVKEGSAPDPEIDSPISTGNINRSGAGGTIQIAKLVSDLTEGVTAHAIVQIYREADGRYINSDSDSVTVFSAPSIASVSASLFGGNVIEIQ